MNYVLAIGLFFPFWLIWNVTIKSLLWDGSTASTKGQYAASLLVCFISPALVWIWISWKFII